MPTAVFDLQGTLVSAVDASALPGAAVVLGALRAAGWVTAVATSATSAGARRQLEVAGLVDLVDHVQGSERLPAKPAPDVVVEALLAVGGAAADAWMVGDAAVDVLAGRAAGVRTIGVAGSAAARRGLAGAGPDVLVAALEDVVGVLLGR